ncbi:MAG: hypothetical protein C5B49_01360 [Bdellovibrio sp.]|nr:MAG: hypothetical protein C5B49_01360 [Bdellovibrio sp.]
MERRLLKIDLAGSAVLSVIGAMAFCIVANAKEATGGTYADSGSEISLERTGSGKIVLQFRGQQVTLSKDSEKKDLKDKIMTRLKSACD